MSHSPDTRCYASASVGWDGRFYPGCWTCDWRGNSFEADQHDAARLEADGHSDPEVLKEMEDWMELCRPKDSPFPFWGSE